MMTPRENMLRAARRQNPEWITLDFGISRETQKLFARHLGANVNYTEYFKFDGRWLGPSAGTKRPTPDWRKLYYSDGSLPADADISAEWGSAIVTYPDTDDARSYYPLRNVTTPEEVDAYPWPDDVGAAHRYAGVKAKVAACHAEGRPVIMGGMDFFEGLWGRCGFEKLLTGMALDEPWARRMYEKHAADQLRIAEQVALCDVDILQTGSDVATQIAPLMSPAMWREWVFPLMRDSIAVAKKVKPDILILYHSDGNVEPLIDGFIEAGVDILNPIQPECMDIFKLKDRYGDRLSFHGGIGVQTTMPFGTPQQVRDTVRRTIDYMGKNGGGYLCSTAHMIRPEVPWENVLALVETVQEYGHP